MQWWAWLVIWAVLVLALIVMLVLLAIRLFRKAIGVLDALADLGEKVAALQDRIEDLTPDPPRNAVLDGYAAVVRRRERLRDERLAIKDERKQARVARGKLLIQSVPIRRT